MTEHFILSGAPGAGKTTLLRQLERDCRHVVEEAATDVIALQHASGIAEPWREAGFIAKIAALQIHRQEEAARRSRAGVCFHDRSLICTHALAEHLDLAVPPLLEEAIERTLAEGLFARRVLFVRLLGFVTPTEARRIGIDEAIAFEHVHEATYRRFGFEIAEIPPGSVAARVAAVGAIARESRASRRGI